MQWIASIIYAYYDALYDSVNTIIIKYVCFNSLPPLPFFDLLSSVYQPILHYYSFISSVVNCKRLSFLQRPRKFRVVNGI